jgi:hypothetical protein
MRRSSAPGLELVRQIGYGCHLLKANGFATRANNALSFGGSSR